MSWFLVILLNFQLTIILLPFLNSLICMSVNHLFARICLTWSANLCPVTENSPIPSHIFVIRYLYFLLVGSLLIQSSTAFLFTVPILFSLLLDFVAWWPLAEARSNTPYMTSTTPSLIVVIVPLTSLFLIPWFDIPLYLRLWFLVHKPVFS